MQHSLPPVIEFVVFPMGLWGPLEEHQQHHIIRPRNFASYKNRRNPNKLNVCIEACILLWNMFSWIIWEMQWKGNLCYSSVTIFPAPFHCVTRSFTQFHHQWILLCSTHANSVMSIVTRLTTADRSDKKTSSHAGKRPQLVKPPAGTHAVVKSGWALVNSVTR